MTYQLGPGAGDRANKEKNDALPPSVSLSLGGGRVFHAQDTAHAKVSSREELGVSEELKEGQCHVSLAQRVTSWQDQDMQDS